MADSFYEHVTIFLAGSTGLALVAHAVNSFPTPQNKYGAWLLGVIQYAVGLRYKAANTLQGDNSLTINTGRAGTGNGFEKVRD